MWCSSVMQTSQNADVEGVTAESGEFGDKAFSPFSKQFAHSVLHRHCGRKRSVKHGRGEDSQLAGSDERSFCPGAPGPLSAGEGEVWRSPSAVVVGNLRSIDRFHFPSPLPSSDWCPGLRLLNLWWKHLQLLESTREQVKLSKAVHPTWRVWKFWSQVQRKGKLPLSSIFLNSWTWWTFELPDLREGRSLQKIFCFYWK